LNSSQSKIENISKKDLKRKTTQVHASNNIYDAGKPSGAERRAPYKKKRISWK